MEAKVISIINQKGGVSKTTTASLLAVALQRKGYKVLAIDTDSQGNMSSVLHACKDEESAFCLSDYMSKIDVLEDDGTRRKISLDDIIQHTEYADVIASSDKSSSAAEALDPSEKLFFMSEMIDELRSCYDFIIIDTGPSKDALIKNSLIASDGVIIVTTSEEFSEDGILAVADTLVQARKPKLNPNLKLYGILLTKFQKNLKAHKAALDSTAQFAEAMGTEMLGVIRVDKNVNDSQGAFIPHSQRKFPDEKGIILFDYAPDSRAAQDYLEFTDRLLEQLKEE